MTNTADNPGATFTHYLPYFTTPQPVAACGQPSASHSTEPTCPACQAWLQSDAPVAEALVAEEFRCSWCSAPCLDDTFYPYCDPHCALDAEQQSQADEE